MSGLDGPHPLSSKLQLRMPIAIARQLSIKAGDRFYWRVSDDRPGTIELIPAEVVERRYAKGEALELLDVAVASELDPDVAPGATRAQIVEEPEGR